MAWASSFCFGSSGLKGSSMALLLPAVMSRRSTPSLSIRPVKPKPFISTPMLPTMLALSTKIWSAATAM